MQTRQAQLLLNSDIISANTSANNSAYVLFHQIFICNIKSQLKALLECVFMSALLTCVGMCGLI